MRKKTSRSVSCSKFHPKNGRIHLNPVHDFEVYILNQYASVSSKVKGTEDIYSFSPGRMTPLLAGVVLRCVKDYELLFSDWVHARLVLEGF